MENKNIENYFKLKEIFENYKNEKERIYMEKYMKNMFTFYGIPSPIRKKVLNDILKEEKKKKMINCDLLDMCYLDIHREFHYFVCEYLLGMNKYLNYDDVDTIKKYVTAYSWWDSIDILCKVIGGIASRDSRVNDLMIEWSKETNIWVKRTSIEFQLGLKEKTDQNVLKTIIENNFNSKEFFINKAIGWALREYSKTNPKWVKDFLKDNGDKMASLSLREASKYLD